MSSQKEKEKKRGGGGVSWTHRNVKVVLSEVTSRVPEKIWYQYLCSPVRMLLTFKEASGRWSLTLLALSDGSVMTG